MASGLFHQALVLGDGRPYCVALLLPGDSELNDNDIADAVEAANRTLPDYARVMKWLRLDTPLSTLDGLLTENGRPRRDRIAEHFALQVDQLYQKQQQQQQETIAL